MCIRDSEVVLPVALAKQKAGAVLQGHYHKRQIVDGVQIVGALARLTFAPDIEHHEPGFIVVNV